MKLINLILIISVLFSCSKSNSNEEINKVFEEVMGKENTKMINDIVKHGDALLIQAYNVKTSKEAYNLFLLDLQKNDLGGFELKFTEAEINSFVNLFEKNHLKHEIWVFSKRDNHDVFNMDFEGGFLLTFKKLKPKYTIAADYYDTYNAIGTLAYASVAEGMLYKRVDLDNCLTKMIINIDFLYTYLTLMQLTRDKTSG